MNREALARILSRRREAVGCARIRPAASSPEGARAMLHLLPDTWATMKRAEWTRGEVYAPLNQILSFWTAYPEDADRWWQEWRAAHLIRSACESPVWLSNAWIRDSILWGIL